MVLLYVGTSGTIFFLVKEMWLRNTIGSACNNLFLLQWVEPMADAGVNQYTFHVEASDDICQTCRKIRESGMKVIKSNYRPLL